MAENKKTIKTIFYTYDGANDYEGTTTDTFSNWLKEHNKKRKEAGNTPEDSDEFTVYESAL